MASWPYNTAQWQRLREAKLDETPLCEACDQRGRVTIANTVDHRVAIKAGGDPFPPLDGLRSMCAPCHSIKTNAADRPDRRAGRGLLRGCDADGRPLDPNHPSLIGDQASNQPRPAGGRMARPSWFRRTVVPLTVVCGPPGAGKSTYVREHAQPSERVICFDQIATALFKRPGEQRAHASLNADQIASVLRARNEMIADLMWAKAKQRWNGAWLILTEPDAANRQWWADTLDATVLVIATPADECHRRIMADAKAGDIRSTQATRFVDIWWQTYRPAPCDRTL